MIGNLVNFIRSRFARMWVRFAPTAPFIRFRSFIPVHYRNLKAFNPDIIYAHDLTALPVSAEVAGEIGAKLIFDAHELEAHRNPPLSSSHKRQVISTERKFLPKCDLVTTVCESAENVLRAEYGIRQTGLVFNAPRLVPAESHPRWGGESRRPSLRIDARLSKNDFALVYVGLITLNRGIEFTLRAMMHTPENIKLVAVGPARPGMRAKMRKYAKSIGMEERLIMLPPVPPPDVYKYIANADASIIPVIPVTLSYEIALPNKFFEAGFAGLPLVCADLFEMRKYVKQYELGIVYDALDETDCAKAIVKTYKLGPAARPKRENIDAFKDAFSWESQEKNMSDMLDKVIHSKA